MRDGTEIRERIARALGPKWTLRDTYSFSLPTLASFVRGKDDALYAELVDIIERGQHYIEWKK